LIGIFEKFTWIIFFNLQKGILINYFFVFHKLTKGYILEF